MLIEVTKDHIKNCIQECEMDCPIALAVCDAVESELSDEDIQHCNVIAVVHPDDISIFYHDNLFIISSFFHSFQYLQ